jgi:hypothetical protein
MLVNVMRIAGVLTVLVLGIFMWLMFRLEKYALVPPRLSQPGGRKT